MKKLSITLLIPVLMLSLLPTKVLAQNEGGTWSIYRPSEYTQIDKRVQDATTDEEASVGIGVHIVQYFENAKHDPYNNEPLGRDGVTLKVAATANTRKGINYQSSWGLDLMDWIEANSPIPGLDPPEDDKGTWVDLPFLVSFYGGPGAQGRSAEYNKVWVSSNGFLSFDCSSTSPSPTEIPDPSKPNTLLAVYWSDLNPSGGTIKYYADYNYFVVTWRNVLDKSNGQRQTFEVIIFNRKVPTLRGQNEIEFLYESVLWSTSARAGIEDQEGYIGTSPPSIPYSGKSVHFTAIREAPEIREITIKLQKSDGYAEIYPTVNYFSLKGYNVQFTVPEPDTGGLFEKALWGYGTLLATTFVGAADPAAGFILKATLVTVGLVPDLARALYPAHELDYQHAGESDGVAYISASGTYTGWGSWPVDALLGDQIEWVFTDANNRDHYVMVTAELKYYSYQTFEIVTISTSVSLSVLIPPPPPPPGGGCPFVYAWNGTQYVVDNNLLGDSEASGGADVKDYYKLEQPLAPREGKYSLLIKEFEREHSYIDQVKLMAVDHDSDVHVAVSPSGEILTYKNPSAPASATDNHGDSQLDLLKAADGNYYKGYPGDYILLDFGSLDVSDGAKLVMRADIEFKEVKTCIHVQALNETGSWTDIAAIRTRVCWATEIVNLLGCLPDSNGELKVRLYFTGVHKLDYVGLDTTKQGDFTVRHANLVSATHSEKGDVKTELKESDGVYTELVPPQQIEIAFTLPSNEKEARTHIIYVKGHYHTIS